MKRIIIILLLLWGVAEAQPVPGYTYFNTRNNYYGLAGSGAFHVPAGDGALLATGSWNRSGALYYDSTGVDSGLYVYHRPYWVKVGAFTDATNGLTLSGSQIILGGALDRYTPITLNGFPLTIRHDGVTYSAQSDSNSLKLANNTAATLVADSLVSPAILQSISVKRSIGAAQTIRFREDIVGRGGLTSAIAYYRISASTAGGAFAPVFQIANTGFIPDNLNIKNHPIGSPASATTGSANLMWGLNSQDSTTTGSLNISIGDLSLFRNKTSNENIAIGYNSLNQTTAQYNTGVGSYSLYNNSTGEQNTAVGKNALLANTTGSKNTGVGAGVFEETTTGGFNAAVGHDAMLHNTTGTNNGALGWLAWPSNKTGSYNLGIGDNSGLFVLNGNRNIALGAFAMGVSGQKDTLNNSIAIGYGAYVTQSNEMVLGNDSLTKTRIYGIAAGAGTKVLRYDPSTKEMTYSDTSTASGTTPTLQNVYNESNFLPYINHSSFLDISNKNYAIGGSNLNFRINDSSGVGNFGGNKIELEANNPSPGHGLYVYNLTNAATTSSALLSQEITGSENNRVNQAQIGYGISFASNLLKLDTTTVFPAVRATIVSSGGSSTWNGITNPTGDQALTFDAGESSTWTNSNTTEDLFTVNTSTLTTSSLFSLNSTSTALASGNNLMELVMSGANVSSSITATPLRLSVTNTGTTSENRAIDATASGASINWSGYFRERINVGSATNDANHVIVVKSLDNTASHGVKILALNETANMQIGYQTIATSGALVLAPSSTGVEVSSNMYVGAATAPTSTLTVGGSFGTAYIAKTGTYTATISDQLIEATTGTFTITLPTAVGVSGRQYTITNSGTGVVTVGTTSSQTFVNVVTTPTTLTLNQFSTVTVVSNGANWLRTTSL